MNYDGDAFISYAHLDNVELVEGRKGWVANLHRALEIRVGAAARQGTADLVGSEAPGQRCLRRDARRAAAPRRGARRGRLAALRQVGVGPQGARGFCKAAEQQGGVAVGDKSRLFKVLKTPVPLESIRRSCSRCSATSSSGSIPRPARSASSTRSSAPRRSATSGSSSTIWRTTSAVCSKSWKTWRRRPPRTSGDRGRRHLPGRDDSDLREQREAIKRDLEQHGYTVLPARPLPLSAAELEAAVRADLARCRMSIHLSAALQPGAGRRGEVVTRDPERARHRAARSRRASRGWCGFRTGSRSTTSGSRFRAAAPHRSADPAGRRPARDPARGSADADCRAARRRRRRRPPRADASAARPPARSSI